MSVLGIRGFAVFIVLAGCGTESTVNLITNQPVIPATLPAAPAGATLDTSGAFQSDAIVIGNFEVNERIAPNSNVFDATETGRARLAGVYNHQTGEFVFTPLSETVVDTGEDSWFQGRDISGYEHVTVLTQFLDLPAGAQFGSDTRIGGIQIAGIPTPRAAMPGGGDVNLVGDGVFAVTLPGGSYSVRADARVYANFDNGRATLTLNAESGASASGEVDSIRLTRMTISNDRFYSGTLTLRSNGAVVTPLGDIVSRQIEGQFFGPAAPDEAGGIVYVEGQTGTLEASFIVD